MEELRKAREDEAPKNAEIINLPSEKAYEKLRVDQYDEE